jgi:hypothetical protein
MAEHHDSARWWSLAASAVLTASALLVLVLLPVALVPVALELQRLAATAGGKHQEAMPPPRAR